MALRTDWPVIDEAVSFPANIGATAPFPYWVSVATRSVNRNTAKRGRQYELNTVQTGEYSPTLDNRDAALSPVNTNGPWAANFQPYCAYRKRAMWPPSVNTLTQFQATGASVPGGVATGTQLSSIANTQLLSAVTTTSIQATPSPFQAGYSTVFSIPVSSSLAANNGLLVWEGFTIWPGLPLSFQAWVSLSAGLVNLSVQCGLAWIDATGTAIGTTITGSAVTVPSGFSAWVNVQLANQTPPANAAGALVSINNAAVVSSSVTLVCGGAQLEQSASCSAFSQSGVWY